VVGVLTRRAHGPDGSAVTAPVARPDPAAAPAAEPRGLVARAAAATAALTAAGALLGLVRDQTLAHLYGAGAATDAFLVSWTVPELAATLLIEDAMALVLIPAFAVALSRRAAAAPGPDPVRALLAATLPVLLAALAAASALLAAGAPLLVRALAPGLADPETAVACTRLTALTLFTFGAAGYFSAALRAHHRFVPPAAIYVAHNLGIIGTVVALHAVWGVRAAAAGVALGGAAMALVQLPAFLRTVPARTRARLRAAAPGWRRAAPGAAAVLAPVALFALSRQAQVLVERYLGSSLPAGAISHLNYAQKVAQIPMVLSLMICTVTFPMVARALADGRGEAARRRVERDLTLAALVVLLGAAYVIACAPQIVELLFQRGAFDAQDTRATASLMRVYALGLLGHSLVGALVRPYFSAGRPTWFPAAVMTAGLLVTAAAGAALAGPWGVHGIAAANAAGITCTALLLLRGPGRGAAPGTVPGTGTARVCGGLARLVLAAAAATAAGWAAAPLCGPPLLAAPAGALVVTAAFCAAAGAVRAPGVPLLLSAVRRRSRHDT
jgi:putative peptidoglycan lipid II flippase